MIKMPRRRSQRRALDAYLAAAPAVLGRYYRQMETAGGACIGATNATVRVFRAVGLPARELPCDVVAVAPDGYAVGVDQDQPKADIGPRSWYGHLVALVGGAWLIDASTRQFCRPMHGLLLPDVVCVPVPRKFNKSFLAGEGWISGSEGTATLSYRSAPANLGYRDAPDWTMDAAPIAGVILDIMRHHLKETA